MEGGPSALEIAGVALGILGLLAALGFGFSNRARSGQANQIAEEALDVARRMGKRDADRRNDELEVSVVPTRFDGGKVIWTVYAASGRTVEGIVLEFVNYDERGGRVEHGRETAKERVYTTADFTSGTELSTLVRVQPNHWFARASWESPNAHEIVTGPIYKANKASPRFTLTESLPN